MKATYNAQRPSSTAAFMSRVSFENLSSVGYFVSVDKPLGVVFSDNEDPYFGLVVDELDPDMNGAKAGLRKGDQLVAVNDESVVGEEFEYVMDFLKTSSGTLELQLYRGTVATLYTMLENMNAFQDEDEEQEIIMDENYETSVYVNVEDYEEKPISAGDVFNALKNIGSKLTEKDESYTPDKEEKKEKKGLFGGMFSQETIQLEGDDAKGLKRNPKNRN